MIETRRMWLIDAAVDDIDEIIALEEHKDNRDYLWIGTREEHQSEIEDPKHILLIFKKKPLETAGQPGGTAAQPGRAEGRPAAQDAAGGAVKGAPADDVNRDAKGAPAEAAIRAAQTVGYALIRLDPKSEIFELRRIAIAEKNKGYGREAMEALFKFAFEELGANRFWLDAYPDNVVGIRLYESLGMHRDGVLRQNYKAERGYLDQIIFSMLKSEYFRR